MSCPKSILYTDHGSVTVGIVSDTHGILDARVAALIQDCDIAIHAGDIMGKHVLDALQPRHGRTFAVRGNNDIAANWAPEDLVFLKSVPHETCLHLPGGELAIVHGHRHWATENWHYHLRQAYPDVRGIVYGHSHYLTCDTEKTPWVLNPGAAGQTRTHGGPSCLVLTADYADWKIETARFSPE